MKNSQYYELNVFLILKALRRRAWAIILAALIFGGAGYAFSEYMITPVYEAEALMYVSNRSYYGGDASGSISSSELTAAQSLADTYAIILKTRSTLNQVIENENLDYTYEQLKDMVSSAAVNGTEIFSVKVTSNDPQEAERIANGIVKVLPGMVSDITDGSSVKVVDYAIVPSERVSPGTLKYLVIGFMLGALSASALITVRAMLDTVVRDEGCIIREYEFPLLAVIPDHFKSIGTRNNRKCGCSYGKAEEDK